eukprot:7122248-Prymnesium_polylepis.1
MNLEQSANAQIGGSAKDLSSIHTACAACNVLNLEEWFADAVKDDATDGAADDVADDLETLSLGGENDFTKKLDELYNNGVGGGDNLALLAHSHVSMIYDVTPPRTTEGAESCGHTTVADRETEGNDS